MTRLRIFYYAKWSLLLLVYGLLLAYLYSRPEVWQGRMRPMPQVEANEGCGGKQQIPTPEALRQQIQANWKRVTQSQEVKQDAPK